MIMRLFIAEKPSLAREIAKALHAAEKGNGCLKNQQGDVITWCFGHILQQMNPAEYDEMWAKWSLDTLPIFPSTWKLKVTPSCAVQFKMIKQLIREADEIVHAGDPDREGQLLVDEVLSFVGNRKPVKRMLLNALDQKSVQTSLDDLRDNTVFRGMRDSALARSRADWLVGMNLSRAFSCAARKAGYRTVFRIGRVKTPTMSLVVRREQEIRAFKPVHYYQLQVTWQHKNGEICTLWKPQNVRQGFDSEHRLLDVSVAENLLRTMQGKSGYIETIEHETKHGPPPLPYSLSALQIAAGKKFGYSPKTVLDTMQSLYEAKLTTYPRSDCDFLPENQFQDAPKILPFLTALSEISPIVPQVDPAQKSRAWNDKKISAHHAIIPTQLAPNMEILSEPQRNLYVLVAKAYVAQFLPDYEYVSTKLIISCDGERFSAQGKHEAAFGWRLLYPMMKEGAENEETLQELPAVKEKDEVLFQKGESLAKVTTPPQRFTPATLIQAMKEIHKYVKDTEKRKILKSVHGIGTEATRATIIEELQKDNQFLRLEKKHLVPTEFAERMVNLLPDELTYPDCTAVWEEALEQIEAGKQTAGVFLTQQQEMIQSLIQCAMTSHIPALPQGSLLSQEAAIIGRCPRCGKPVTETKLGFSCQGYKAEPRCTFTLWKENKFGILAGRTISGTQAKTLLAGEGITIKGLKSKAGKNFDATIFLADDGQHTNFRLVFPVKERKRMIRFPLPKHR